MSQTLISLFAQFVQGDIKGGAHAHAFRTTTIRSAIEQMFKGNYAPINEATALTEGKAKKARAYHTGFASFGVVGEDTKKVDYVGKLDSAANKEVRAIIDQKTHAATVAFFVAFDAVMAEKAKPKAETMPGTAAPATAPALALAPVADTVQHDTAVQVEDTVASMVAMIANGVLTGAQLSSLFDAMTGATRTLPAEQASSIGYFALDTMVQVLNSGFAPDDDYLDSLGNAVRAAEGRALLAERSELTATANPVAQPKQQQKQPELLPA